MEVGMNTEWVTTAELKVGDTIAVWWGIKRDTIIGLRPYVGPLAELLGEGTKIADFALFKPGMTLEANNQYQRIGG
jgi:hypothetical protein